MAKFKIFQSLQVQIISLRQKLRFQTALTSFISTVAFHESRNFRTESQNSELERHAVLRKTAKLVISSITAVHLELAKK